ncbi:MAG: hypothetical protein GWN67_16800 [Phycisphaerae bacterium]|nr:DUF3106 domain-containing protein [Phycisphaerae bacterium]NIP53867.1 DUF3106 domain-containing protein [Phycisphaerae bacterium]NIS52816.1 DUF3106 domain-containing protein [Phycisphaerae bacterium]NIU10228.1 DUF3106 domain-containing protein [Phycisphaerae bacterium]NIU57986.1 hypothetical protein [Phycisphaerae bacterium]
MKLDYLKNNHSKNNRNIVSIGLLGISAFMVVLILIKVTGFFAAPARAEDSVKRAVELTKPDPNDTESVLAKSKEIADQLKKNNLFAPPIPKRHPVNKDQVLGILGDEVFINGKWYKAGDNVGDAKIVAITPVDVTIEWDGNEQVFVPFDAKAASPSGPRRPGGPSRPQVAKAGEQGTPQMVQVQQEGGPEGMGRFGGDRGDMMARMREMRERWESMSPEERERARAEMRERFGGRGPGGGRGPRGEGGFGGRRGGRGR